MKNVGVEKEGVGHGSLLVGVREQAVVGRHRDFGPGVGRHMGSGPGEMSCRDFGVVLLRHMVFGPEVGRSYCCCWSSAVGEAEVGVGARVVDRLAGEVASIGVADAVAGNFDAVEGEDSCRSGDWERQMRLTGGDDRRDMMGGQVEAAGSSIGRRDALLLFGLLAPLERIEEEDDDEGEVETETETVTVNIDGWAQVEVPALRTSLLPVLVRRDWKQNHQLHILYIYILGTKR